MLSGVEHIVYLGLGSNLGDREHNLRMAVETLHPEIFLLRKSPIYETKPWGYAEQADFLNQVVEVNTGLPPGQLLDYIKNIENKVGRRPTFKNGPREIDIDILYFDDLVMESDTLTIPHPRLADRAFMLTPLADLIPDFKHPTLDETTTKLLENTNQKGINLFPVMESRRSG